MSVSHRPVPAEGGSPEAEERAPHRPAGSGRRAQLVSLLQRHVSIVVLVVVAVVATVLFPTFGTAANLRNVAIQNALLALIAVGMTLVIVAGGIDLSVGSLFALGGVVYALGTGAGVVVGLLLAVGVCGLFGVLHGVLVARARMAPFIVTLAGLLGARGLALALSDEVPVPLVGEPARVLGQGSWFGLAIPVYLAVAAVAVGSVVLNRTRFGQSLFAIGGSEEAARLMGLRVTRGKVGVYVASAALAGFAGALLASRLGSGQPTVGVALELDAIASVVIGGTLLTGGAGSVTGTLAGVLLLGVIQNLINLVGGLGSYSQQVVSGVFLLVVVVVQRVLSRDHG